MNNPCFNPLCMLNRVTGNVARFIPLKCKSCEGRKLFITDDSTARRVRSQHRELCKRAITVYISRWGKR